MKLFFLILFTFFLLRGYLQQYNNFYFSRQAGLCFSPSMSQPVVSYSLDNSAMNTEFACNGISNSVGNLLLYTNGVTVYNWNHSIMLNGAGLVADTNLIRSSIIVPHPAYPNRIFNIFSSVLIDPLYPLPPSGYRYSIVDMSKDGGNGDVTVKDILLYLPSKQKLTAVRHADGVSVWLITIDNHKEWYGNADKLGWCFFSLK